ncbi:hypothetical protein MMMDOFMJ_2362 [Methylobacterium gnaphalii]|nr:hypothetical protein MMMDOFMJ_2362 [Methylobacterium gnaphalii]
MLDWGKLDSAVNRPRMCFAYDEIDDVGDLAVLLMFAIARSHAFQQGNKRTGFVAADVFLKLNGYRLTVPDIADTAKRMVAVIEGHATFGEFQRFIDPYIQPIP